MEDCLRLRIQDVENNKKKNNKNYITQVTCKLGLEKTETLGLGAESDGGALYLIFLSQS